MVRWGFNSARSSPKENKKTARERKKERDECAENE
jgi:hypothetical protein